MLRQRIAHKSDVFESIAFSQVHLFMVPGLLEVERIESSEVTVKVGNCDTEGLVETDTGHHFVTVVGLAAHMIRFLLYELELLWLPISLQSCHILQELWALRVDVDLHHSSFADKHTDLFSTQLVEPCVELADDKRRFQGWFNLLDIKVGHATPDLEEANDLVDERYGEQAYLVEVLHAGDQRDLP